MGRARTMVVDAAQSFRTRPEDRLTELVATVAKGCPPFAAELLGSLDLPVGDTFVIDTQLPVRGVGKPDLVIKARKGGAWLSQLWFEHKLNARDQPDQVPRYLRHLREQAAAGVPGELYYVVDDIDRARAQRAAPAIDWQSDTPDADDERTAARDQKSASAEGAPAPQAAHGVTWQHIAELAHAAGTKAQGADWRSQALAHDAPAQWRLLAELAWYLDDRGLAVLDALDMAHVNAIAQYARAFATLSKLLVSAVEETGFTPVPGGDDGDEHSFSAWEHFEMPDGTNWLRRFEPFECAVELCISDRDRWSPARHDEPCLGAGFTIDGSLYEQLATRHDWIAGLEESGFCFSLWEDTAVIYRTKRLAELVDAGGALPAQAATLGRWAREAFLDLGRDHDPGDVVIPTDDA